MRNFFIITGAGVVAFALFVAFVEFSGLFADAGISTFGWFAFLFVTFLTILLRKFVIITVAGVAAFALFVAFVEFSGLFADAGISTFGWFAFMLAAFLTILVSSGLFALIFFSARTGRDDISEL